MFVCYGLIGLFLVLRFALIKALRAEVWASGHLRFAVTATAAQQKDNDSQLSLFIQPEEAKTGHD